MQRLARARVLTMGDSARAEDGLLVDDKARKILCQLSTFFEKACINRASIPPKPDLNDQEKGLLNRFVEHVQKEVKTLGSSKYVKWIKWELDSIQFEGNYCYRQEGDLRGIKESLCKTSDSYDIFKFVQHNLADLKQARNYTELKREDKLKRIEVIMKEIQGIIQPEYAEQKTVTAEPMPAENTGRSGSDSSMKLDLSKPTRREYVLRYQMNATSKKLLKKDLTLYTQDGLPAFIDDNWELLKSQFGKNIDGPSRMVSMDFSGTKQTLRVSENFRKFILATFKDVCSKKHKEIWGDDDMNGCALDGTTDPDELDDAHKKRRNLKRKAPN